MRGSCCKTNSRYSHEEGATNGNAVVVDVVDVVGANSEWIESEISKTLVRYTYSVYHTICHVFVSYIDPFKDIKIGTYCTKRVMSSHRMTVDRRKNNSEKEAPSVGMAQK
jgi:hypothetical protein